MQYTMAQSVCHYLQDVAALALLDLSTTFHIVDHRFLRRRLQSSFDIHLLSSFLGKRPQCVHDAVQSDVEDRALSLVRCVLLYIHSNLSRP